MSTRSATPLPSTVSYQRAAISPSVEKHWNGSACLSIEGRPGHLPSLQVLLLCLHPVVSSVTHVRRPLPAEVPPDTRIRRLHLRKGAWWAWAPSHDPLDDHLYDWLRLDEETQQQISFRLARLEVPQSLAEEPMDDPQARNNKEVIL